MVWILWILPVNCWRKTAFPFDLKQMYIRYKTAPPDIVRRSGFHC